MNDIAVSMMKSVVRQMLDPQKEAYMSGFPDDLSNPLDEQPPRKNPHAKALGKLGGKAKSEAKTTAVRENGKLGGRPAECSECHNAIKPGYRCFCPACKVPFCFKCWSAHVTAEVCAYGKAKVIDVL